MIPRHSYSAEHRRHLQLLPALVLLAVSSPRQALAETSNSAVAEALFRAGRAAMREHRLGDACDKFSESQRVEPKIGTLLNLALCHEQQGRLATAWAELRLAQAQAEALGKRAHL
ncbi:MAG TPA: hypothetical protein VFQ35_06440, partial [Polyangiaceae bacterium]|nr:hypothetical protein [Polyangiaceae bacterium]